MNGAIGAHFTPSGLARDFAIDAGGGRRVIDLCAGIGGLGFWLDLDGRAGEMVCVEVNPAYVEVGRKILPQAQWICGDVFALPDLGWFDLAISNPPFGRSAARSARQGARYTGASFEYHVMDMAADMAGRGAFMPPRSAPFRLSGAPHYTVTRSDAISERTSRPALKWPPAAGGYQFTATITTWRHQSGAGEFEEAQAYREAHPPKSTTARAVRSSTRRHTMTGDRRRSLRDRQERAASHEVPLFRGHRPYGDAALSALARRQRAEREAPLCSPSRSAEQPARQR